MGTSTIYEAASLQRTPGHSVDGADSAVVEAEAVSGSDTSWRKKVTLTMPQLGQLSERGRRKGRAERLGLWRKGGPTALAVP